MSDKTRKLVCDCDSIDCTRHIYLPLKEVKRMLKEVKRIRENNLIIIIDGCPNGPGPKAIEVKKGKGYTLYGSS